MPAKSKPLDTFQRHQKRIALDTLRMSDVGAQLMGGTDKPAARNFLRSIGYTAAQLTQLESAP
jgi:hypothetical protein